MIYGFVFPLAAAISLVYSATRHEDWGRILRHAARLFATIVAIMVAVTALLVILNSQI